MAVAWRGLASRISTKCPLSSAHSMGPNLSVLSHATASAGVMSRRSFGSFSSPPNSSQSLIVHADDNSSTVLLSHSDLRIFPQDTLDLRASHLTDLPIYLNGCETSIVQGEWELVDIQAASMWEVEELALMDAVPTLAESELPLLPVTAQPMDMDGDEKEGETMEMTSIVKKRRLKMRKHKWKKRKRRDRHKDKGKK